MPTADPAATVQPHTRLEQPARRTWLSAARHLWSRRGRSSRVMGFGLAVLIAIPLLSALPQSVAASASPSCNGWTSLTRPPDSIRVLRVHTGRVIVVPFRKYVVTVMGKEWPSYLPQPVIEAGSVAVKQYAWYHAVYSSRRAANGQCFDVRDSTGDQLYKPRRARVRQDHYDAVDVTWNVSLRKDGRFFMTGYRRGYKANCGRDATGYKLFARSATRCARRGYSWRQILETYYGPRLALVDDSRTAASASSNAALTAPTTDSTDSTDSTAATTYQAADSSDSHDSAAVPADSADATGTTADSPTMPGTAAQPAAGDRSHAVSSSSDWQRIWMDTLRATTVNLK